MIEPIILYGYQAMILNFNRDNPYFKVECMISKDHLSSIRSLNITVHRSTTFSKNASMTNHAEEVATGWKRVELCV